MELTFTNGSSEQQQLWGQAFERLLNLPANSIPLSIEVSFEDPDIVGGLDHNDFASTAWVYDSSSSTMRVRNDFPGFGGLRATMEAEAGKFGVTYTPEQFAAECAAHELGHAYFAALPQSARSEIAQMFGAASDDLDELLAGDEWEDRVIEGIAETFKDAFLPKRFRVFPNRTRQRIAYADFPRFRELWRVGTAAVSGELPEGETPVPSYDEDLFSDGSQEEEVSEPSEGILIPGTLGRGGIWTTLFFNDIFSIGHNGYLRATSRWEGWVKDGTTLTYSLEIKPEYFIDEPYEIEPKISELDRYQNFRIFWELYKRTTPGGGGEFELLHTAEWSKTIEPEAHFNEIKEALEEFEIFPDSEWLPGWILTGLARGHGAPPTPVIEITIEVNEEEFPEWIECGGQKYRFVALHAQPVVVMTEQHPVSEAEGENLRQQAAYPWYPELPFKQSACGATPGEPIDVPEPDLTPEGQRTGARPRGRPVTGSRA